MQSRTTSEQPVGETTDLRQWAVSHAQRRLWVVSNMLEGEAAAAYNMPVALRLGGALDIDVLRKAFDTLLRRHEVLRTTFRTVDGEPKQFLHPEPSTILREVDFSDAPNPEPRAREYAENHASAPFDLAEGPLLRATVLRLSPADFVLLFNIHHIVFDQWSLGVIVAELSSAYSSFLGGEQPSLPELRIQYKDFAAWQNGLLGQPSMQAHRDYWLGKLSGSVPGLNLAYDFARPALKSYDARTLSLYLDRRTEDSLRGFAASRRTTLFTTLVAIVKTLLFRYSGQHDITIGCPVAGREHPSLQNQIGLYVNTLALRDTLDRSETFGSVLGKVRNTVSEALEHQIYPFDKLVSELNVERDVSRSPLFDVSINLNSTDLEPGGLRFPGVAVSYFDNNFTMAKVDLSFDFSETSAGLQLTLIYSTSLFSDQRMRALARHFEQIAESCVRNPDCAIGRLTLLNASERTALIHDCAAPEQAFPHDRTFVELFEDQVAQSSNQVAIAFEGTEISYGELNERANRLANHLRACGIGPEVPVGVFLHRSPELIVALMGIWKAAGVYVPLDTAAPVARVAAMLKGCLPPIVVTTSELEDTLPTFMGTTLCLDTDRDEIGRGSANNPTREAGPQNTAYLIHTSGSTGTPKAVAIEHRGLSNLSEMQVQLFGLGPGERALQFASPTFDASIFETVMALRVGATLYPGTRDALLPGTALLRFLSENRINLVTFPPSALAMLPKHPLPDLRTLIVAGETCSAELLTRWGPGRRFFNLYGPTEATVWSAAVEYGAGSSPPSIGKPIGNTQLYLVDEGWELVPHGNTGEICIGGTGVGRGYLSRPELTAEKFVPDPFGGRSGSRLYRTGDLGRRLPDGSIEFLGRADHQVKVRGYRIELGEVEAVLGRHPEVQQAVVVARDDGAGSKVLAGYVVPAAQMAGVPDLRSWLRTYLPEYMVPSTITALSAMPLSATGKIDRKALPHPDAGLSQQEAHAFVAPRTDLESVLARIFSDVLGRARISVTDSFFDMGGHSLLATQVVSRIRESLFIEIPLSRLFQWSTIAQLAEHLRTIDPGRIDKVARAVERLQNMPEEEKQQLRVKMARTNNTLASVRGENQDV